MGVDSLDMELEDVIKKEKGGSKGRSKGSSKGSAKGRLWGGARAALQKGAERNGSSGKKPASSDAKLDMSLEDVVQADIGDKRRGKGEGRQGKGKSRGKGRDDDWGSKGSRNGYSSKGKGRSAYSSKGKGYSRGGYDGERRAAAWSQHDTWRADEDDDDDDEDDYRRPVGVRSGISGLMRQAGVKSRGGAADDDGRGGRGSLLAAAIGRATGRTVTTGGGRASSYMDRESGGSRLGGESGWTRVAQDEDDDESERPARRTRAGLGIAAKAAREAAGVRKTTSAREKEKAAAKRRAEREEAEPPRKKAREEAAPATKKKDKEAKASRRIKITNVAKDLDDQDIKEAFEAETGKILECTMTKSTAYITFAKASDAVKAVETFDRGELNGKQISVTIYEG